MKRLKFALIAFVLTAFSSSFASSLEQSYPNPEEALADARAVYTDFAREIAYIQNDSLGAVLSLVEITNLQEVLEADGIAPRIDVTLRFLFYEFKSPQFSVQLEPIQKSRELNGVDLDFSGHVKVDAVRDIEATLRVSFVLVDGAYQLKQVGRLDWFEWSQWYAFNRSTINWASLERKNGAIRCYDKSEWVGFKVADTMFQMRPNSDVLIDVKAAEKNKEVVSIATSAVNFIYDELYVAYEEMLKSVYSQLSTVQKRLSREKINLGLQGFVSKEDVARLEQRAESDTASLELRRDLIQLKRKETFRMLGKAQGQISLELIPEGFAK